MYKKLCPKCRQPSFSSSDIDSWICPVCNIDLTRVTSQDAESPKGAKPQLFIIKNSFLQENQKVKAKIKPFIFQSFD